MPAAALLGLLVQGGCRITYPVDRDEIAAWKSRYYEATSGLAGIAPALQFVHTGHRAGSTAEYPGSLGGSPLAPDRPRDIACLMDAAFGELGLTAIEIDAQVSPLDGRSVAVAHDRIASRHLSASARAYIERNSLAQVLEHFAESGYAADRRIFIELKAPLHRDGVDERTQELIERVALAVRSLEAHPQAPAVRRRIAFLAFNFAALQRLRTALDDTDGSTGYGYFLMASSNRVPAPVINLLASLPRFDDEIVEQMTDTPWLTGTVFSPKWISGFAETFNEINRTRVRRGTRPLDLHLAVYADSFDGYLRTMREATGDGDRPLEHVAGFVYDLREAP